MLAQSKVSVDCLLLSRPQMRKQSLASEYYFHSVNADNISCGILHFSVTLGENSDSTWKGTVIHLGINKYIHISDQQFVSLAMYSSLSYQLLSKSEQTVYSFPNEAVIASKWVAVCVRSAYAHWRFMSAEKHVTRVTYNINPLSPELNPICYLLALLGAHHFLHVSRIRVKSLTLRRLMSYIYGAPILDVSRSNTTTQHSR